MTLSSDLNHYLTHPLVGLDRVVIGPDVLDSVQTSSPPCPSTTPSRCSRTRTSTPPAPAPTLSQLSPASFGPSAP